MSSVAYRSPPIQPGVAPDANYLMRDLDMQFTNMVRMATQVGTWHTRFAWMPDQAFSSLRVDMPIDLSSFEFEDWKGIPTFKKGTNVKIRHEIAPFWKGTYINLKELEDPNSAELIGFEQRAQQLFSAWNRHLPPKIYSMLNGAQAATISGGHPVTGATNFFSVSHYYNVDHPGYGTFANLIDDGGASSAAIGCAPNSGLSKNMNVVTRHACPLSSRALPNCAIGQLKHESHCTSSPTGLTPSGLMQSGGDESPALNAFDQ